MTTKKKSILMTIMVIALVILALGMQINKDEKNNDKPDLKFGQDYIAVINVEGPIVGTESVDGLLGATETANSARLMRDFRRANEDEHAKAVLLRINSPGGSATATQEIGIEMERLRANGKPIVVSMGDVCASGGYWLAAQSDYIFANPSTMTGSIGVYIGYTNYEALMDKIGVQSEAIKSGAHKDILSPNRPMTDEERALVQDMVNDIYEQFVDVVADGRRMNREQVKQLADGRIFTGRQALELGLVDGMGNYYDALAYTAEQVGLDPEDIDYQEYHNDNSFKKIFGMEMKNIFQQALLESLISNNSIGAKAETEVPHVQ